VLQFTSDWAISIKRNKMIAGRWRLIEKQPIISSPANRIIVYKLETAFGIMVAHEKRHLGQEKEVNQLRVKLT